MYKSDGNIMNYKMIAETDLYKKFLLIFLVCILTFNRLLAQEYKFEALTTDQGLSQNLVYAIFQDSRHFLWIATADGLNRYDGTNFKIYKSSPENPNSISGHHFSSIVEDKNGNLWIGSYGGGLNKYSRMTESFTSYKHNPNNPNSPIGDRITTLLIDRKNYLWIGTEFGLCRMNLSTGKYRYFKADIKNPDSLCNNKIYAMTEDSEGKIWIGTWTGLSMFDYTKNKFKNYFESERDPRLLYNNYIHKIYEDRRKNLWIGTAQGLYLLNRKTGKTQKFLTEKFAQKNEQTIQDIIEDKNGNFWIASFYSGLILYDRDKKIFHSFKQNSFDPNSMSSNVAQCLYEDDSGILWIGTMDGGLNKLDFRKSQFKNYKTEPLTKNSITNNHISSIFVENENSLWIGTLGGGINNLVRSKPGEKFTRSDKYSFDKLPISNNLVYSIIRDKENNLWFGTEAGLAKYNKQNKSLKIYNTHTNASMVNNAVFKVLQSYDGKIWIGTYGGGMGYLDQKTQKFTAYTNDPNNNKSISIDVVRYIFEDTNKNMWVCTENGLDLFDRKKNEFYHFRNDPADPQSIVDNKILLIFESSKHELWVGTPFGLCKIVGDIKNPASIKFIRLSKKDGLAGNSIQGIQEDEKGNLWISSNDGISQYNPADGTINNYDVYDGMISNEYYVTACSRIKSTGELVYGGNKGLVIFNPTRIMRDLYVPPVVLTALSVNNIQVPINQKVKQNIVLSKSITETNEIHLSPNQNDVSLEFAALNFANPQDNKFKYKLEGLDSSWNYLGNRKIVSFTNLDPGEYTFRVTAANHNNIWNENGVALKIIIDPPFYKTILFKTIAVLGFFGFILLVHNYRTKNIQKRSLELQEEVNRRTSELTFTNKQLHDEVVERIKVEEKLRTAKEAAESASRSKSEFLANVSHELRTPLNAILGYTQIMRRAAEISEKHKSQLLIIQQSGEHLLSLINDILDLRRIEMKREVINEKEIQLFVLLREVVDAIRVKAQEKNLVFEFNASDDLPEYIISDAKKLKQILMNLLSNAVKYTNEGFVRLTIASENIEKESTKCKIKFVIEDSGIGIPKEKYTAIFLPFKSSDGAKENADSVGLGLAISKRLVEFLGGNLKFNSNVGKGTIFSFELKFEVVQKSGIFETKKELNIVGYSGERKNILVVDDNPTNRSMLETLLQTLGFNIQQAGTGKDALALIKEKNPDLILLDLLMPEMSGEGFLHEFYHGSYSKFAKVIGVSAAVADTMRIGEFSLKCDAFISKPIDIDLMLKLIGEQLGLRWNTINDPKKSTAEFVEEKVIEPVEFKPSQEILDEIISKVNVGDFAGVNRIITTLSDKDEYKNFCLLIDNYSKEFNDDAIIQLCKN